MRGAPMVVLLLLLLFVVIASVCANCLPINDHHTALQLHRKLVAFDSDVNNVAQKS